MGQQEVYDFLKRKRKPHSSKEIAKALNVGVTTVQRCLSKLVQRKDITRIKTGVTHFQKWRYVIK